MYQPVPYTHEADEEKRLLFLIATLGLEISRRWNDVEKRAAVPLTRNALRFTHAVWKKAFKHFQEQGWVITPIEPMKSKLFPEPGFFFAHVEFR